MPVKRRSRRGTGRDHSVAECWSAEFNKQRALTPDHSVLVFVHEINQKQKPETCMLNERKLLFFSLDTRAQRRVSRRRSRT
eukprot:1154343-Pelagomonas_calceolata.AAC.4